MTKKNIKGEILSPGVLAGRLHFFEPRTSVVAEEAARIDDPEAEIERFEKQVEAVVGELDRIAVSLDATSFDAEAEIVRAHIYVLQDPQFHRQVHEQIRATGLNAQQAADNVLRRIIAKLQESESWLSERTADFRDLLNRLKSKLSQEENNFFESLEHAYCPVIAAHELLPSLVLEARRLAKCAFVVEKGTGNAHAAILAKSFGFPAIRIENLGRIRGEAGHDMMVDAVRGYAIPNPTAEEMDEMLDVVRAVPAVRSKPSLARLWINITDPRQVRSDLLLRVEGIGLYRSEVLFMAARDDFPSEDEQYRVYRSLFESCKGSPVTFRTADIGGDKMLPYFSLGPQENPYLGLRAHRIYRFHPEILVTQIRAVLRASRGLGQLRIMYPMIEDIEELRFVQSLVSRAVVSLKAEGDQYQESFLQGIMVEVPSAAWDIDELLQRVDFASVGTNDLLQYFLAADRNNSNIAASYRGQSPAFLKMLKSLVRAANRQGKTLSICGEIASSRSFLPLLIGVGFKDISVDAHVLNQVEVQLNELHRDDCEELAATCLQCRTSEEVRVILREFGPEQEVVQEPATVAPDEAVDPVCKMIVHAGDSSYIHDRHGKRYYFCSARCRDEFAHGAEERAG